MITSDDCERPSVYTQQKYGVDFREYKLGTLQRRTSRRMALHKIAYVSDYVRYLGKNPAEAETLLQDLLIPLRVSAATRKL